MPAETHSCEGSRRGPRRRLPGFGDTFAASSAEAGALSTAVFTADGGEGAGSLCTSG